MLIYQHKAFKAAICLLLILIFYGSQTSTIFAINKQLDLEQQVEAYLKQKQNEKEIAGLATIIISGDKTIYKMAGYADIEEQILVDENTIFEWGSVSKILIWISVLQLVETGQLDLETDIKTYLPNDFQLPQKFEAPITLRHLMHHTAGFEDSYTDLMILRPHKQRTLREVLEEGDIQQVFPPGEIVAYSNYGSGLAAYLVEQVSGLDYQAYVHQHILQPLQMTETAIHPEQEDHQWVKEQRGKVQGYSSKLQLVEPNLYSVPLYPVGSVMGTATDLQKLLQALLDQDGTLLFKNKKTIKTMFEPTLYYPKTEIPRIANGLFYLPSENHSVFGHGGNSKAFSSSFYADREEQIGVLVLTNIQNESTFTAGIPEIIFGEYTHVQNKEDLEDASKWNGIYEPARLSYSGFSRVYGLFLRGQTKQSKFTDLIANDWHYSQLEPGIYKTADGPSLYSLDVYSEHPQMTKVLSNITSDLLYIPYYKHLAEWGGVILGGFAILFSFTYVIATFLRSVWKKKTFHLLPFVQHILNLLMFINVLWIVYKTLSMVSYAFLKPYLTLNLIYCILSVINLSVLIIRMKDPAFEKREKRVWLLTLILTVILCGNIVYWAFYY